MNDLSQRLAHEADQFTRRGGTELELSQVLARAGEIKRGRRMRATMLMAACVLAIAVPTALVAAERQDGHTPTPARKVERDLSPLQLSQLTQGQAPRTGYVVDDTWHGKTSMKLSTAGRVLAVVPLGSRFLVETDTVEGVLRAAVVPSPPEMVGQKTSWPVEGGLAASARGGVAAFVQPDGTPVVVQDEGQVSFELPGIARGSGFDVVAVTGEDCKETAANPGCTVWVNSSGRKPGAWVSTSHGFADRASSRLLRVADVAEGRLIAGTTEVADTGSCSEVEPVDTEAPLWTTCEHRLLSFSPDGSRLLASAAYADGLGDSELTVLDSRTGKVGLNLRTTDGATITQTTWEDDSHVLATVYQDNRWAVLRISLDGRRELALPPVEDGGDLASPYVLPTR